LGLSMGQWLSVPMIALGVLMLTSKAQLNKSH